MTLNATLAIKDRGSSMPVMARRERDGFLLYGHNLYMGDAYGSQHVELSGGDVGAPIRVMIKSFTQDGHAWAIPHFSVRRN